MTIEKINFTYPKGTLQSVFDAEEMTALELASKTSKKVDECVELVNGVEQSAIEATAVVDEMRISQEQFMTENNDIRQQLVIDNQGFIDGLESSQTTFETNMTTELDTFKVNVNTSKTAFETEMTTAVNTIVANAEGNIQEDVDQKITDLITDGTIEGLINVEILGDVKTDIVSGELTSNEATGNGVINGLNVLPQASPDLSVLVAPGIAHLYNGRRYNQVTNITKVIDAPDALYDRIDIIYISALNVLTYGKGDAALIPVAPVPVNGLTLAEVYVEKSVTQIIEENVIDKRIIKINVPRLKEDVLAIQNEVNTHKAETAKVVNVIKYADETTTDWSTAINAAILAANPDDDINTAKGRRVFLPDNTILTIDSPIVARAGMTLCGNGRASIIKKGENFIGEALIIGAELNNVNLENILLDGIDKTVDGIKYTNVRRYNFKNVVVHNCNNGGNIDGYIGDFDKGSQFRFNNNGLILSTANGVNVSALIEQNTNIGLDVVSGNKITIENAAVIEGNGVGGIRINSAKHISISAYFELNGGYHVLAGDTELVQYLDISNITTAGGMTDGDIVLDNVEYVKMGLNEYKSNKDCVKMTTNTRFITFEDSNRTNSYLVDPAKQIVPAPMNLYPNGIFEYWKTATTIAGVKSYSGNNSLAGITKEETIVRTGHYALRVQPKGEYGYTFRGINLEDPLMEKLKGKIVTIAAFIYVPDIPEFISYGPCIMSKITATEGNVNKSTSNASYLKGYWNLMLITTPVPLTTTNIEIDFYVNNSPDNKNINQYIIVDNLAIVEGEYTADKIASFLSEYSVNSFNNVMYDDLILDMVGTGVIATTPDGTKKYRIGVDNDGVVTATLT